MFAETDADEGHDWDIFNINEGLWTHQLGFAIILYCIKCLCLLSLIVQSNVSLAGTGLDLLEGDILQEEVRSSLCGFKCTDNSLKKNLIL